MLRLVHSDRSRAPRREPRKPRWGATPEERVRIATRLIFAVGFTAALAIYLTAEPPPENPLGYDPLQNKAYLHQLEVYGGKANVLMAQFRDWFDSLWHGKRLAFTVAVMTVLAVAILKLGAALARAGPDEDVPTDIDPNRRS